MNVDFYFFKKYWWIVALVSYLGLGSYFEGLRPVFTFQLKAHAQEETVELAQTNKKLDEFACMQVVIEYQKAKNANDLTMIAYWTQQAQKFGCKLPT